LQADKYTWDEGFEFTDPCRAEKLRILRIFGGIRGVVRTVSQILRPRGHSGTRHFLSTNRMGAAYLTWRMEIITYSRAGKIHAVRRRVQSLQSTRRN
jgi:hypothetical protein